MLCITRIKKTTKIALNSTIVALFLLIANCSIQAQDQHGSEQDFIPFNQSTQQQEDPVIKTIHITGNHIVPDQAIAAKVPFSPGDTFNRRVTPHMIRAIHALGYFQNIQIVTNEIAPNTITLHIIVIEKKRISNITYEGNVTLTAEKINEKLESKNIKALDEEELNNVALQIKKFYAEKGYHHVKVTGQLLPAEDGTFDAHFTIDEGVRSRVKLVNFVGNANMSEKLLRTKIFTREDWLLGFFDKAGTYHPDAVLQDKYTLENYYQSNGYFAARVTDTQVEEDEFGDIEVTFVIDEGDLYTISCVQAPGNDLLSEAQILGHIPIFEGQLYSKDLIRRTMEILRNLWGEYGHIYADIQPSIRPDEKTKTVSIAFHSDLGDRIYVNRINIIGNRKTRDNVIRREILFNEGEQLTTRLMEASKNRVELLGYFDPHEGVNWKIIKLDEETADLDLMVREIKTGKIYAKAGIGAQADAQSPTDSFSVGAGIHDTNFRGSGIRYSFSGSYARHDKIFNASLSNSWLFDRPIYSGGEGYLRKTTYEDFHQTVNQPVEEIKGGSGHLGFRLTDWNFLQIGLAAGCEKISYETNNIAINVNNPILQGVLQAQIDRTFQAGSVAWFSAAFSQDLRNHPLFPTAGYNWAFDMKVGIPHQFSNLAFFKLGFDGHWFTPIIEEYGVTLHCHGFFGYITELRNRSIPYRELFHIGGPATVRGFKYGQIGPQLQIDPRKPGSSLGGTKAFTFTSEILFPITQDGNMRGVIFYDGGASWDTPDACKIPPQLLRNNNFDFRHAIGFGLSLQSPTPVSFQWGFKLDRKNKRNERLSEIHISMSQTF